MIPSVLLIGLLLAATPLFALEWYEPMLPLAGVGMMVAALAAAWLDALVSQRRDALEVRRGLPKVLSLGVANTVSITLRNRSGRTLQLIVKDDPPGEFDTPERVRRLRLEPWQTAQVSYHTTPTRRGDYQFGNLHVRCLSRLRLAWWQRDIAASEEVRVYPNLQQITQFDALARRGRLDEIGLRAMRARGEGTEFESLREYVPDDSFRDIDWKATARRGKPITRQFQAERNQIIIIMIDCGRMMAAQVAGMARVDHAINAALMLAHVAERMGDTVGLLVFSDRVKSFVPPSSGTARTERLLQELYALQAEPVEPDFRQAVTFLRTHARKRALICTFTDLVDPDISREALSYVLSLRPRHLPLVATIADDEIQTLACSMPVQPIDAYEKALAARALADRELALARLRSRGTVVADAPASELAGAVVSRYLAIKRQGLL